MTVSTSKDNSRRQFRIQISKNRRRIWLVSLLIFTWSLLGFVLSWKDPSIGLPLRPGLDFTGGTQIQIERFCDKSCEPINTMKVNEQIAAIDLSKEENVSAPNLSRARVQSLDDGKSLVLKLPFLSAIQSKKVVDTLAKSWGPFINEKQSIDTIGPSLGGELLRSSLVSLMAAFVAIAIYISIRYDRRFALLAIFALVHDVIIICGIFAWLGLFISVEVDSLFAVALLTIAGYSVNDTVVIFDRIREKARKESSLPFSEQIDRAVSSTLTRTLYTSGTSLLPLLALILFGGKSLFWFAIALASGIIVGSWSSIALAPSILTLYTAKENTPK